MAWLDPNLDVQFKMAQKPAQPSWTRSFTVDWVYFMYVVGGNGGDGSDGGGYATPNYG